MIIYQSNSKHYIIQKKKNNTFIIKYKVLKNYFNKIYFNEDKIYSTYLEAKNKINYYIHLDAINEYLSYDYSYINNDYKKFIVKYIINHIYKTILFEEYIVYYDISNNVKNFINYNIKKIEYKYIRLNKTKKILNDNI